MKICGGLSGVRGTECTWGLSLEKKSVFVVSAEPNHACECRSQRSKTVSSSTDLHFILRQGFFNESWLTTPSTLGLEL